MVVRNSLHDGLAYLRVVASHMVNEGITSYCKQVCGGGNCGSGPICHKGIDPRSQMPSVIINRLKCA